MITLDEAIDCFETMSNEYLLDKNSYANGMVLEGYRLGKEYKQFAEWLKELKELREQNVELKSTLNAALKDIHDKNICEVMNACKLCAMKFQQLCDIFPWQYANEALKLIGDNENG